MVDIDMAKRRIIVSLEVNQIEWLDGKAKRYDFASRAHGIRYCIQHVIDESKE